MKIIPPPIIVETTTTEVVVKGSALLRCKKCKRRLPSTSFRKTRFKRGYSQKCWKCIYENYKPASDAVPVMTTRKFRNQKKKAQAAQEKEEQEKKKRTRLQPETQCPVCEDLFQSYSDVECIRLDKMCSTCREEKLAKEDEEDIWRFI